MREITEGKFLYETTIHDDGVVFGFDSSELSEDTRIALDGFAARLKEENRSRYIEIQGHTDNVGPESYNFHLGLARARAVMSYLYTKHDIPLNRMNTYSYGATKPIADNSNPSERAKNRRVSLVVMSEDTPSVNAQSDGATEGEYLKQDDVGGDSHAAQSLTSKSPEEG
jgi:outer membrane protein OmpA-like peptidoglycan-associated protein